MLPTQVIGGGDASAGPPGTATLTVQKTGNGRVTSADGLIDCGSDCTEDYPNVGSVPTVEVTATADPGESFLGWGGDCQGTTDRCALQMSADRAVTAGFTGPSPTPSPTPTPSPAVSATPSPSPGPTTKLRAKLTFKPRQSLQAQQGSLIVSALCKRPCVVALRGRVVVPGRGQQAPQGARAIEFRLETVAKSLQPDKPLKFKLLLSDAAAKAIDANATRRRPGIAKLLSVTTTDAGNSVTKREIEIVP